MASLLTAWVYSPSRVPAGARRRRLLALSRLTQPDGVQRSLLSLLFPTAAMLAGTAERGRPDARRDGRPPRLATRRTEPNRTESESDSAAAVKARARTPLQRYNGERSDDAPAPPRKERPALQVAS